MNIYNVIAYNYITEVNAYINTAKAEITEI